MSPRTMTMTRSFTIPDPIPVEGYRQLSAKQMSEKTLLGYVVEAARRLNWFAYHTHNSRYSEAGFPDLILIERDHDDMARLIAAELKRESAAPTVPQVEWLNAFHGVGAETYLWRPSHWISGEIIATLQGRER